MRALRRIAALVAVVGTLVLAACTTPATVVTAGPAEPTHWVVMTFAGTEDEFDPAVMDALLDYELEADAVLQSAVAGWVNGNEIGAHQQDLYFVGFDRTLMWGLIRPAFYSAPYAWSRVELRNGLDASLVVVVR